MSPHQAAFQFSNTSYPSYLIALSHASVSAIYAQTTDKVQSVSEGPINKNNTPLLSFGGKINDSVYWYQWCIAFVLVGLKSCCWSWIFGSKSEEKLTNPEQFEKCTVYYNSCHIHVPLKQSYTHYCPTFISGHVATEYVCKIEHIALFSTRTANKANLARAWFSDVLYWNTSTLV